MMETAQQLTLFNRSSRLEQWQQRLIINNLDRTNREIGQMIARSETSIANFLHKQGIKRTPEQLQQVRSRIDFTLENNPNWKNGISKNNYHYKLIQMQRYPEKHKARTEVWKAYRRGYLIKQPCCICSNTKSEFHHFDYSPEFSLCGYFVCRKHHKIFDRFLRIGIDIGKYFQLCLSVNRIVQ